MWNVTNIALDRSIASSLSHKTCSGQAALTIGAIGVVLGNIGTSPLYAVDQIFYGPAHLAPTPDNVSRLHLARDLGAHADRELEIRGLHPACGQ